MKEMVELEHDNGIKWHRIDEGDTVGNKSFDFPG